jgi:hypothetical protein
MQSLSNAHELSARGRKLQCDRTTEVLTAERSSAVRIGFSTQIALRRGTSPIDRAARVRVVVGRPDLRSRWSIDFKDAGGREAVREYVLEGVYYCRVELRAGAAF